MTWIPASMSAFMRLLFLLIGVVYAANANAAVQPISASYPIYLGGPTREWSYFEGRTPLGQELRLKFSSAPNPQDQTLIIRQDDVKQDWTVTLNGRKLGSLFLMEADLIHTLTIPANLLKAEGNELQIAAKRADDIVIHSLAIANGGRTSFLNGGALTVNVTEQGEAAPARITIVDSNGTMAAMEVLSQTAGRETHSLSNVAVRPGVVYTATGSARLVLAPGKYTLLATRGPEYSLAKAEVTIGTAPQEVALSITREVDTDGWVSSDTHIHTLSLSKHGDALLHERVITLAGEGIDLPIVTEHNQHADYSAAAKALGLLDRLTIVPGNEVTTTNGHFNVFPISLTAPPVDHTKTHWPDLLDRMRQSPGVRIAILNHPTDTHVGFTPFAATNLNPVTGENLRGDFDFTFDAMELINSGAMRTDWLEPIRAWFALLNRGYRIAGVGSSDSHDVSRFIVGQGRTYIQGDDGKTGNIDVQKVCDALKQGRAVASLGLFPQLRIADAPDALDAPQLTAGVFAGAASSSGDLHTGSSKFFEVHATVDFPTWMNPEARTTATVYANGRPLVVFPFEMAKTKGKPLGFKARFPKPKADTWYVLVADTPGVTNAHWSIARPYQPSSPKWDPAMIGVTNPIWMDADGDGRFTPPRKAAEAIVNAANAAPQRTIEALADFDWAIGVHAAEILRERGNDLGSPAFQEMISALKPELQQAFADYSATVSK